MNIRHSFLVLTVIAMVATLGAACTPEQQLALQGILQNVDSISGDVTVEMTDGTTMTFNLENVDISTLQETLGAASLEPGTPVTLAVDSENHVNGVQAHRAEIEGTIIAFDSSTASLTVQQEDGQELIVQVTADTEIKLEGHGSGHEVGTIDDLIVGTQVEVKHDPSTGNAVIVEIEDSHDDEDEGDEDETERKGTIVSIDTNATTVTVLHENGTETVYTVESTTKIDSDNVRTFGALKEGMEIEVKIESATNRLIEIEVDE